MARIDHILPKGTADALRSKIGSMPEPTYRLKYQKPNGKFFVDEYHTEDEMVAQLQRAHLKKSFTASWYRKVRHHVWKEIECWKNDKQITKGRSK